MGVDKLSNKDNQPFYNVMVEDGSIRYAADESLEIAEPRKIPNQKNIGKYFKEFRQDVGYIPNDSFLKEYPEDPAVAEQLHLQHAEQSNQMDE